MSKPKRRTDTREAVRALVRSVHGLTKEVGILRRYILEMRDHHQFLDPGWAPMVMQDGEFDVPAGATPNCANQPQSS